jgi:S-adenosylmethionine:diacylglycerol 3-amino-3-carboxypropyl transferase
MAFLFDFGISQEDPLSEQYILDLKPSDRVLSLASGGEVPLSLLSLIDDLHVKAVDISEAQIKLCRIKIVTVRQMDFPLSGQFLGYSKLNRKMRLGLYHGLVRQHLSEEDAAYWDQNQRFIEKGVVNAGRFEQYINKLRSVASLFIGKRNLIELISCQSVEEQEKVFDERIATRKSLQLLFKIAFHPAIYRKRGLQDQALIHAGKSTGEKFYSRFRDFCTSNLAGGNYFLQYFLIGRCITEDSYPLYLQPVNRNRLLKNLDHLELTTTSLQSALAEKEKGYYNKIHMSNLGDWMSVEEFSELLGLLKDQCNPGTKICARYLQKNQFTSAHSAEFPIDPLISSQAEKRDRFPFYTIQSITL